MMPPITLRVLAGMLTALFWIGGAGAQTTPSLTITSPADGTSVQPGQTINVTVTAVNTPIIDQEWLVGDDGLGHSAAQPAAGTITFQLPIPARITPGTHYLTAQGVGDVNSQTISLVVPVTFTVNDIRVGAQTLISYPGQQIPLDVSETTSQGFTILDPSFLKFTSADPTIATVSNYAVVTGQSPGQTKLSVTYGDITKTVTVIVNGSVRGDLNGDGKVDIDDVHILQTWLNNPANGPNDARDLDHDGQIDALDARILTTLCTYPRCATHP